MAKYTAQMHERPPPSWLFQTHLLFHFQIEAALSVVFRVQIPMMDVTKSMEFTLADLHRWAMTFTDILKCRL